MVDQTPKLSSIESGEKRVDSPSEDADPIDVDNYHGLTLKTVLVYISICLISGSQVLNLVGSGAFSRDIGAVVGDAGDAIWLPSVLVIITCVVGPPVSQAADYWGRKWFIIVGTILGAVGCIIVARATSMGMAIGGQVIASLTFGSQPLLYAVVSEILPRKWRGIAQGGLNVAIQLAAVFSLLVGFALTQSNVAGFRTFFEIATGIQAVAALIVWVCYNPPLRPLQKSLSLNEKLSRLDWIGYSLLGSGIILLSLGLDWYENPYPWVDAHTLAPFFIGIFLLGAFTFYEWKIKKDGMFHHDLFKKDRNFAISSLCIFVEGMVFTGANNFFVFEVNVCYESDLMKVGERFTIGFFMAGVTSVIAGLYASRFKKLRVPTVTAFVSLFIFNVLMATATLGSSTAMWGYPVFLGFGLGTGLTLLFTAAQLSAPPSLISISSGLLVSLRSLGGSIALAIYNAIFASKIAIALPTDIAEAVLPLGLPTKSLPALIGALAEQDEEALLAVPGITPKIIGAAVGGLKLAYLQSFQFIWVAAAVFSAVAAIVALFIINPAKDLNMHVDAPLENEE